MRTLLFLNDAPYGSECTYNALRLAATLYKQEGNEVHIFLIGDASSSTRNSEPPFTFGRRGTSLRCPR